TQNQNNQFPEGLFNNDKKDRQSKEEKEILTLEEILNADLPERKWLVDSLIPHPGITIIGGNPGNYKTWITQDIALCISRGENFLDHFETQKGNVLVVDEENHLRVIKERMEMLGADKEKLYYLNQRGVKVDDEEKVYKLKHKLNKYNIKLLILDSFIRVHDKNENSSEEVSKVFGKLKEIVKKDISILITHHLRKGQQNTPTNDSYGLRGSSDILAAIETYLKVENKEDNLLVLKNPKMRQAPTSEPIRVEIKQEKEEIKGFTNDGVYNKDKSNKEQVAEVLPEVLNKYLNRNSDQMIKTEMVIDILKDEYGEPAIRKGLKLASKDKDNPVERIPKSQLPDSKYKKAHYYRLVKNNI
ncbi:MAG: AAA family ATPase, partial [Candidatus Paceibacteria bacterium]